jgi:HSP20 family protein
MSLIPYDPFQYLSKAFDRFFSDFPSILGDKKPFDEMQVDVQETKREVIVTCNIPGLMKKEDATFQIENDSLTISAFINKMVDIREENLIRKERYIGRFHHSIPLPSPVSHQGIKTSYHHGVFEVRMTKLRSESEIIGDGDVSER